MKNEKYEETKYKGYSKYLILQDCSLPIKESFLSFYEGEIIFLKEIKYNYFIFYRPHGPALIDMDKTLNWYSNGFNTRNNGPCSISREQICFWEYSDSRKDRNYFCHNREESYWNC